MKEKLKILIYHEDYCKSKIIKDSLKKKGYLSVVSASTEAEAYANLKNTRIVFCWKFPIHLLSHSDANKIEWVQSMGAGINEFILNKNIPSNILLTRITDQFGEKISEYIFSYLLYVHNNIEQFILQQRNKKWLPIPNQYLCNKKIGIAGLGSIGKEVIRKAKAFNMTVYGLSYSGKNATLVDKHFSSSSWNPFIKELDVLVVTLPLTKKTYHIISEEILSNMKKNSWLVNVGRGELIKELDLVSSLQEGHIGGAILDVFETEPLPRTSKLWNFTNVYITPHISGPSIIEEIVDYFLNNLDRFIANDSLEGLVDWEKGF